MIIVSNSNETEKGREMTEPPSDRKMRKSEMRVIVSLAERIYELTDPKKLTKARQEELEISNLVCSQLVKLLQDGQPIDDPLVLMEIRAVAEMELQKERLTGEMS